MGICVYMYVHTMVCVKVRGLHVSSLLLPWGFWRPRLGKGLYAWTISLVLNWCISEVIFKSLFLFRQKKIFYKHICHYLFTCRQLLTQGLLDGEANSLWGTGQWKDAGFGGNRLKVAAWLWCFLIARFILCLITVLAALSRKGTVMLFYSIVLGIKFSCVDIFEMEKA